MVAAKDWNLIHDPEFPPVLFDLRNDPDELIDLGQSGEHSKIRAAIFERLASGSSSYRQREIWLEEKKLSMTGMEEQLGVLIVYWVESDADGKNPKILPNRSAQEIG